MFTTPPHFVPWALFFVALGATWYLLDRRFGAPLYRWWYNMTHEHPIESTEKKGFIYYRKAKAKLATAIALALVQSGIVLAMTRKGMLMEFVSFFLEVPATMLGFYVGPWLSKLWIKKDAVLDKVDQLESGELSVVKEVKEAAQDASEKVKDVAHDATAKVKDLLHLDEEEADGDGETEGPGDREMEGPASPAERAPEPKPEPEAEPDPRELMNKYLRKDDD